MATYYSSKITAGIPARAETGQNMSVDVFDLTAALANGDIIQMCSIPAGAKVTEVVIHTADLDSNGSPTISFTVGDGADADRFILTSTVMRTGGIARLDAVPTSTTGAGYEYTSADTIDIAVTANPATGATSGRIVAICHYYIGDKQS